MRKTPEDWLGSSETEEARGRLKVFLDYAPGVGKTFSMLSEGIRRRSRGEDVVVGIVETHGRSGTSADPGNFLKRLSQAYTSDWHPSPVEASATSPVRRGSCTTAIAAIPEHGLFSRGVHR